MNNVQKHNICMKFFFIYFSACPTSVQKANITASSNNFLFWSNLVVLRRQNTVSDISMSVLYVPKSLLHGSFRLIPLDLTDGWV
jgi:hypothetical protein